MAGLLVFLLLYGTSSLNPTFDTWVFSGYDESDILQHYAGWLFFRNAEWSFPLGLASNLAWPDGTVISYTDSLPWISIILKLFRGILPATVQWFGWYTLICFMLHGCAGALLSSRGMKYELLTLLFAFLAGLLFVCMPTLWERAFRHTALASQWLFLFALYFYLEYRKKYREGIKLFAWQMPLLAFLSVGIHPYFLPLVMVCALVLAIDYGRYLHRWYEALLQFVVSVASALIGGIICGAIGHGVNISRGGYGHFSMNLNAIVNPKSLGKYAWSQFFPILSQNKGQYDGFNYLGLGIIILLILALGHSIKNVLFAPDRSRSWWNRNIFLFYGCLFLSCFAISHHVYLGSAGLEFNLPKFILDLCGIFRASSRMFYLVSVCMLVYGIYSLRETDNNGIVSARYGKCQKVFPVLLMFMVLGLQLWDLHAVIPQKRARFEQISSNTRVNKLLDSADWKENFARILCTNSSAKTGASRRDLAVFAGKRNMSTNINIANSGKYPKAGQKQRDVAKLLMGGKYDADTVYVTADKDEWLRWRDIFKNDASVSFLESARWYFFIPTVIANTDTHGIESKSKTFNGINWKLANLTDKNWTKGLSNFSNGSVLLFHRDEMLLADLSDAHYIVCGATKHTILNIEAKSKWIHVKVDGNARDCMYPAPLSLLK